MNEHGIVGGATTDAAPSMSSLKEDILRHIQLTLGNDPYRPDRFSCYMGLAYSVRDRLTARWIKTQRALDDTLSKRVYFLSMEFLPGRFLRNYLSSLRMEDEAAAAVSELGFELDELEEEEPDPGLGNGGLGRLASCYLDSIACLKIPGYGYGIRYDYGIFHQVLEDGFQREQCDNWLRRGDPWEIQRRERLEPVRFRGRSESYIDGEGRLRYRWVDAELVLAMACDILIPSHQGDYVTNMRLWSAQSGNELDLEHFSHGDYMGAVEAKVLSESISKVLYPSDEVPSGKELRLKQQYFFVAATLQDIIRQYKKQNHSFNDFSNSVAIQLNDTHPSIAVPELMRILVDEEALEWNEAWDICQGTFAYTNHTVLPEALETWPVDLMASLLPRHLEIIYEINRRFLESVRSNYANEPELQARLSLIQEGDVRLVRMAHIAIVASHVVNGVAALHSRILKDDLFRDFDRVFPTRFQNITNGITPRRWLYQANPSLSRLITAAIGPKWIDDLGELQKLTPLENDSAFRTAWMDSKMENKKRLARYILRKIGFGVNPASLFDVQVKRMHEYKRQLLNILHVVALYNRMRSNPALPMESRTIIFGGKAAPSYHRAKLIIKLITSVADVVNRDADIQGRLRVVFLPNYCVSQSEKIIPAADLSEQISTAGMEASGTGNMKMSLNGALTIGTLDGANVEIMEAVGRDNIFIFGLTTQEVSHLRSGGYNPHLYYDNDAELRDVLNMIGGGYFSPENPRMFTPIVDSLLNHGDYYMLLADFRPYLSAQKHVGTAFQNSEEWCRKSILNVAQMGGFSSDRAVLEYANRIWNVQPLEEGISGIPG